jgi:conjugal transfer/entry exclusion protein
VALVEANVKLEDTKRELEETVKELKKTSSLEISHITESENKIKQLESELKESNESLKDYSEIDAYKLKSLHEGVSKIKKLEEEVKKLEESKEVLRKLRDTAITNENKKVAENISLKENHKKEIIKIVVENKLEKSGLKLNKQTISLLENCQSVEEINQQIKNLQNSLRENLVNTVSGNINEIKVEAVDNRSNVQKSIDSKIEASLKNFGI